MRVSALRIAAAVLAASGDVPEDPNIARDMAACIGHGNGALRVATRTIWLVLGPIHEADNPNTTYPLMVRAGLRATPRPGALLSTLAVASSFREAVEAGIGRPSHDFPWGYRKTWAPCPLQSDEPVPMGGVSGVDAVANTIDVMTPGNEFDWFNLEPLDTFPIGCLVYRFKANGALVAYQRLTAHKWLVASVANASCPIDLKALKAELEIESIEPFDHPRPLLYHIAR